MKEIIYYSNEVIGETTTTDEYGDKITNPIFEIQQLKYKCKKEEFDYWLDVIIKTYGKYGEVTYKDIEDIKTKEEIQQEVNAKLLKDSANLQIELEKQKKINATLLKQVAQLGGNK